MDILIFGASGYIGQQLYKFCRKQGHHVLGTGYMRDNKGELIKYDLERDGIDFLDKRFGKTGRKKYAVICAGESKIGACRDQYDKAYNINVTATIRLIEQLREQEYHIVYCSSDNVYDGRKGNYKEIDAVNPVNAYGKMKLEVEQYMMRQCPDGCVVRLGKVVGVVESAQDMLYDWREKAMKKESISCIEGNYFTPVYVGDVVQNIIEIMNRNCKGIFNLGGNKKYSRVELCKVFLDALGMKTDVYEKPLGEFGFNDDRPLDTSMCSEKLMEHIGGGYLA